MSDIAQALADPTIRGWYLLFCFAVMILPLVGIAAWYHLSIGQTAGGRELMKEQEREGASLLPGTAVNNAKVAARMAKDIAEGRYGDEVKRIQRLVYLFIAVYLTATFVAFGILLWADEVNRPPA